MCIGILLSFLPTRTIPALSGSADDETAQSHLMTGIDIVPHGAEMALLAKGRGVPWMDRPTMNCLG